MPAAITESTWTELSGLPQARGLLSQHLHMPTFSCPLSGMVPVQVVWHLRLSKCEVKFLHVARWVDLAHERLGD